MEATKYLCLALFTCASTAAYAQQPVIGLITKTETNPFFVKMKEGAQQEANAKGAKLMTGGRQVRRRQRRPGHRASRT